MTVLIGHICQDGLVIAADCMISVGDLISYPADKISFHGSTTVLALAGSVDIGARFQLIVEQFPDYDSIPKNSNGAVDSQYQNRLGYPLFLSQMMRNHLSLTGIDILSNPQDIACILGYVYKNEIYCCSFDGQMQPGPVNDNHYYISVGSGSRQSYPILRMLNDSRQSKSPPDLTDGCLISYWSIERAIKTSPAWIGHGIKIVSIFKHENNVKRFEIPMNVMNNFKLFIEKKRSLY